MSETKRPLKVFLCHARDDKSKARELYRYLKKRGIQPWLDAENLLPGQNWQTEIPKAIETSDAIIICLSKSSVDKEGYVQKEIKFALDKALEMPEGRIFIIPARLDECDVPRSLGNYHWVDLFEDDGSERLMKSLKHRATQLQGATIQTPKLDEPTSKLIEQPEQESESDISKQKTAWAAPMVHNFDFSGANLDSVIVNPIDPFEFSKQLREQAIPKETRSIVVPANENEIHQITLEERRKELLEQKEKAIQYEHLGNKREALNIYEDLKRSDILLDIKDIDTKILALKQDLNSTDKSTQERKPLAQWIFWIRGIVSTIVLLIITWYSGFGMGMLLYYVFGPGSDFIDYLGAGLIWLAGLILTVWLGRKFIWKRSWFSKEITPIIKTEKPISEKKPLAQWAFWIKGVVSTLILLAITWFLGITPYFLFNYTLLGLLIALPMWFIGISLTVWLGRKFIWKRD